MEKKGIDVLVEKSIDVIHKYGTPGHSGRKPGSGKGSSKIDYEAKMKKEQRLDVFNEFKEMFGKNTEMKEDNKTKGTNKRYQFRTEGNAAQAASVFKKEGWEDISNDDGSPSYHFEKGKWRALINYNKAKDKDSRTKVDMWYKEYDIYTG